MTKCGYLAVSIQVSYSSLNKVKKKISTSNYLHMGSCFPGEVANEWIDNAIIRRVQVLPLVDHLQVQYDLKSWLVTIISTLDRNFHVITVFSVSFFRTSGVLVHDFHISHDWNRLKPWRTLARSAEMAGNRKSPNGEGEGFSQQKYSEG